MEQYAQQTARALAAADSRDTPAQKAEREEKRRRVTRSRAETARRMGEDAELLKAAPPTGGPIKNPLTGMR